MITDEIKELSDKSGLPNHADDTYWDNWLLSVLKSNLL